MCWKMLEGLLIFALTLFIVALSEFLESPDTLFYVGSLALNVAQPLGG